MPDVVYCHSCHEEWFRDEWGLICPYCDCEATEIVVVDHIFNAIPDALVAQEILNSQHSHVQRQKSTSSLYGGIVQGDEAARPEVVIAVMGVTGSGKSTFIRTMTGNEGVLVGHTLESATSEVKSYRFAHRGLEFVLVDTPGFNDTNCSDEEIMTRVLKWLETSFRTGTRLNGLIYLHRIIDPKMQGSALSNIRMFRKLCGPGCFQNIVLATTFWSEVTPDVGAERERQLKDNSNFWGEMVKKGSQIVRLGTDRDSGLEVLMDIAKKNKITLQSQHEMVSENKPVHKTTAAQAISEDVLQQKREFERKLEEQRLENERKLQQQMIKKQKALEQARRYAREQERRRAVEAAKQKAREEAELEAEYEQKRKELREEKERVERECKEQRAREEKRRKDLLAAKQREEEALRAERKRYYDNYTCQRGKLSRIWCDKCYKDIKDAHYWHCCHCDGDNHDECNSCSGNDTYRSCGVSEHPWMQKRWQPDDDCIVM